MIRRMWECALLSTLLASAALGDTDSWVPLGPEGGNFSAIAVDPEDSDVTYALSNTHAFRRGGRNEPWQQIDAPYVAAIAVAPGGRVYLSGDGLYRSRDHGRRFERLSLPERFTVALAVDPSDSDVLYAAFQTGIRRSDDGGESWSSAAIVVADPQPLFDTAAIAVNAAAPSTVYAALQHSGVFVSADSGATWSALNEGLPCPAAGQAPCLTAFAALADEPSTLFAAAYDGVLYRYDATAAQWTPVLDAFVTSLLTVGSETVFVGSADNLGYDRQLPTHFTLQRSDDGGDTWHPTDGTVWPRAITALAVEPGTAELLFVGTGWPLWHLYGSGIGLFRHSGDSWQLDQIGLHGACASNIVATGTSRTSLFTGMDFGDGLYASNNGGEVWRGAALDGAFVAGLTGDPNDPSRIYGTYNVPGFTMTVDAGATWTKRTSTGPRLIERLAVDARDPSTLYAVGAAPLPEGTRNVWKSEDGGDSWRSVLAATAESSEARAVAVDEASNAVYAVFDFALFRSRDAGEHWDEIDTARDEYWWDVAVAPTSPPTILRVGSRGLEISADDGGTWRSPGIPAPFGAQYITTVAVDPSHATTLYTAAEVSGGFDQVFRSDDSGFSWSPVGESVSFGINALAVDPHDRRILYAATCASAQSLRQTSSQQNSGDGCAVVPRGLSTSVLLVHALTIGLLGWLRARC